MQSFQLILNTQGANVIDKTSLTAVKYNINWSSFLPKRYKKFHCQFIFKSSNAAVLLTNGFVNVNLGQINSSDGNNMSQNLGIIYPIIPANNTCYLNSTNNDNNDFWVSYPSNQIITVKLNQFDNVTAIANMPEYVMIINFRGVEE